MVNKKITVMLKAATIVIALCVGFVCYYIVPVWGASLAESSPELERFYVPWLVLILICSVPCLLALLYLWKLSSKISSGKEFALENSVYLKRIALLAYIDSGIFLLGNLIFAALGMHQPGVFMLALIAVLAGVIIGVAASALGQLFYKAYELQDLTDGTV